MTSERIKEIQQQTAYPDSISVQQALLQVWNECSQLPQQEKIYTEEEVIKFGEMIAWNMVGKTITESFIRTVSKELFKQIKKD